MQSVETYSSGFITKETMKGTCQTLYIQFGQTKCHIYHTIHTTSSQLNKLCFVGGWQPGGWINIKMSSYQYRKCHCGDKTILRPSYLHNGISYTGKMTSLYWIRALQASLLWRWGFRLTVMLLYIVDSLEIIPQLHPFQKRKSHAISNDHQPDHQVALKVAKQKCNYKD